MARIRTIKPEFWSDGAIIECSTNARLLFIGTWNFADDFGNLDRSAKQIKAQVFPADNVSCEPLLQELLQQRLLVEYSSNGKKYLHIPTFSKHQKVDRPGPPRCPPFDEASANIPRSLDEHSTPDKEGKGREVKALSGEPDHINGHAAEILAFLNEKTGRKYRPVPANIRLIEARLRDGATPDEVRAVVERMCTKWGGDAKMADYLRPATLFNATKFAQYQGEADSSDWQKDVL